MRLNAAKCGFLRGTRLRIKWLKGKGSRGLLAHLREGEDGEWRMEDGKHSTFNMERPTSKGSGSPEVSPTRRE